MIPLDGLSPIPPRVRLCGIYFLFAAGELLYVGQSNDIHLRIEQHIADGAKPFDSAAWLEVEPGDLDAAEGALIRRFNPPLNSRAPRTDCDDEILARFGLCPCPETAAAFAARSHDTHAQRRPSEKPSRIRDLRVAAGLSQQDLANACGTGKSSVCDWERGRSWPTKERKELCAAALGVSVADLHRGDAA